MFQRQRGRFLRPLRPPVHLKKDRQRGNTGQFLAQEQTDPAEGLVDCELVAYGAWGRQSCLQGRRGHRCHDVSCISGCIGTMEADSLPRIFHTGFVSAGRWKKRVYDWKKCRFKFLIGLGVLRANSMSLHLHKDHVEVREKGGGGLRRQRRARHDVQHAAGDHAGRGRILCRAGRLSRTRVTRQSVCGPHA